MDDVENIVARAIVENGYRKRTIVSLRRKQSERLLSFQAAEASKPMDEPECNELADLARGLPPEVSDQDCWNTFITRLRESGFTVRELPPHDYQLQAMIDLHETRAISMTQAADDAIRSPEGDAIARRLHERIAKTLAQQQEEIESKLASFVDASDNVGAAEYVACERGRIHLLGNSRKILELLLRIETAGLTREKRRSVLEAILSVAVGTSRYGPAAMAAEAMLTEFGPELGDAIKRNLVLCRANARRRPVIEKLRGSSTKVWSAILARTP